MAAIDEWEARMRALEERIAQAKAERQAEIVAWLRERGDDLSLDAEFMADAIEERFG